MMKAPEVDRFIRIFNSQSYTPDKKSIEKLDKLYSLLSEIEPCGDDDKHVLWISAERGTIDDYGNYEEAVEYEEVSDYNEFVSNWKADYPDEISYFLLTTVQYKEFRTVLLNREPIVQIDPEKHGWEHDITDLLDWMIKEVSKVILMLQLGEYNNHIQNNLPYRYRKGTISMTEYWQQFPEAEQEHFSQISREQCAELEKMLMDSSGENNTPNDRIEQMTVNKYLQIAKLGYDENELEGYMTMTPVDMYKRYADDRDGGFLTIDRDSSAAFDDWYNLPNEKKWDIDNPSHMWEVMQGSSRTRVHLYVQKDEKGYYLSLAQNEFCCPEHAAKFYMALRRNNIPVNFYSGLQISAFLSGKGKVGIVPCFDNPPDYYYGGFADKKVGEFIHLPEENTEDFIYKVDWMKIREVKLKGESSIQDH